MTRIKTNKFVKVKEGMNPTPNMKHHWSFCAVAVAIIALRGWCQVTVSSADELLGIFDTDHFVTTNVILKKEIDFSKVGSEKIPIGINSGGECVRFNGVFDGNNKAIKGLKVKKDGTDVGLFCGLDGATVKNVVFDQSCSFEGARAATVAPTSTGNVTLENVQSGATIQCTATCGGLIGEAEEIHLVQCQNTGKITADGSEYVESSLMATNQAISFNLSSTSGSGTYYSYESKKKKNSDGTTGNITFSITINLKSTDGSVLYYVEGKKPTNSASWVEMDKSVKSSGIGLNLNISASLS